MKWKTTTLREICEEERQRLLDMPKISGFEHWAKEEKWPRKWMVEQFGPTLMEKDGFINAGGGRVTDADCDVCGKESLPDQKVVIAEAGEHDDYFPDTVICESCLDDMKKAVT
jgi:hypothetical protein